MIVESSWVSINLHSTLKLSAGFCPQWFGQIDNSEVKSELSEMESSQINRK